MAAVRGGRACLPALRCLLSSCPDLLLDTANTAGCTALHLALAWADTQVKWQGDKHYRPDRVCRLRSCC